MGKIKKEMVTLRIDRDLKKEIKEIAEEESRTVTGQILYWVRQGMRQNRDDGAAWSAAREKSTP